MSPFTLIRTHREIAPRLSESEMDEAARLSAATADQDDADDAIHNGTPYGQTPWWMAEMDTHTEDTDEL